ncbi:MAG: HlyC/CorC family transporter [Gammaproteobacteria bacterium AqS3]|nr:HlyC/CorC family transporter [Gammaproteobacteria bacterium AqS3]
MNALKKLLSGLFSRAPASLEQIEQMLLEAHRAGVLEQPELELLQGALQAPTRQVREIMVPRPSMAVIQLGSGLHEIAERIEQHGHSRYPVVGDNLDDIRGLLLAKDVLRAMHRNDSLPSLHKAHKVPETMRLDTMLNQFRESHNHMAIVVDEYGGVSGLITIEDVLEQIVGNIQDEHDSASQEMEAVGELSDGSHIVKASITLIELKKKLGIQLDGAEDEYETLGGFLLHRFGRVPVNGERLVEENCIYEIVDASERKIQSVRLHSKEQPAETQ